MERLSTQEAELLASVAAEPSPPAVLPDLCVLALKYVRLERQLAEVQRELNRLQNMGDTGPALMDLLHQKQHDDPRLRGDETAERVTMKGSTSPRTNPNMAVALEEKFDEVRQLIVIGKEKGYLLYDEVNDLLPADLTANPEDLEELLAVFSSAGIELVDSEKGYKLEREGIERQEGPEGEGPELDLTPGSLDKTNDPVRMYLREMGTVPLLTREGEVEIARRIERGKLSVIKSISRMPAITKAVIRMGDQLRAGERTIRELVIFNDEEITEDKIEQRAEQFQKQVDAVRKARLNVEKLDEKLEAVPRADKKKYRKRALEGDARAGRDLALHPQDRVHRAGQAPPRRRSEGHRRARLEAAARARQDQERAPPQDAQAEAERGREEDDDQAHE